jgi:DNA polymerase IV (archaeal DinB-like DNA polymerase)
LKYYVGCKGWKNQSREFYPPSLDPKSYLAYYSKVFDFVEIDFNRKIFALTDKLLFKKWSEDTHDNFRFSIKLHGHIVQDIYRIGDFLEGLAPLKEKVLAVVIQPPPPTELTLRNGREWLDDVLRTCTYHGYSAAFEFNHSSWFQDLTFNLLDRYKAAVVWSEFSSRYSYPVVTGEFLYLRINGNERKWIEKVKEKLSEWNGCGERNREEKSFDTAIIVVDNPEKVNSILKLLDLTEKEYGHRQWVGKLIMHVDLNSFFPSCEELRDQTLRGKPHAVIMTDEAKDKISRGAVASCSYEARKYGVRSAMSLFTAKQLCPQLILNPVDKSYYNHISEKVMNLIEEYADVLEQASIDEAFLDCTKKITDSTISLEEYAAKIKDTIKQQCGLLSSIGVGPTKSAAKIASDYKKPNGLTVIYPDQLQEFFESLEVDRIVGIGVKTQKVLKDEMRIQTIGHLAKCDVQRLMGRFGKKNGLWMWQVANGKDYDPVIPREDHVSVSTEHTLGSLTNDKKKILIYLNGLVEEVYGRVVRYGYEFRTVGVKLVKSDFSIETREVSFSNPRTDRESITSALEGLVGRFSFDNTAARKVGIKISNLVRIERKKPLQQKTLLDYI